MHTHPIRLDRTFASSRPSSRYFRSVLMTAPEISIRNPSDVSRFFADAFFFACRSFAWQTNFFHRFLSVVDLLRSGAYNYLIWSLLCHTPDIPISPESIAEQLTQDKLSDELKKVICLLNELPRPFIFCILTDGYDLLIFET